MMDNKIQQIEIKAAELFKELGFEIVLINQEKIYKYKECYHRFSFVGSLGGFVIESAMNRDEAEKNIYEDSDIFPISDSEELLNDIETILRKYYLI